MPMCLARAKAKDFRPRAVHGQAHLVIECNIHPQIQPIGMNSALGPAQLDCPCKYM